MKCPNCGHNLPDTARFCNKCGQPIVPKPPTEERRIYCPNCGASLPEAARFCNKCGQPLDEEDPPRQAELPPQQPVKEAPKKPEPPKQEPVKAEPPKENPASQNPPSQEERRIHCPNCGASLPEAARFCNKCGQPLDEEGPPRQAELPPQQPVKAAPQKPEPPKQKPVKAEPPKQEPAPQSPPSQQEHRIHCPNCGASLPETMQFCNKCGTPIRPKPQKEASKAKQQDFQDSRPEQAQRKPKAKNTHKGGMAAVIVLIILAALVLLGVWLVAGKKIKLPEFSSSSAASVQEAASSEQPEADSEQDEAASEWIQVDSQPAEAASEQVQEQTESQPTAASSAAPEPSESAPAAQTAEEWGRQEIRVTPTGGGMATLTLVQEQQGTLVTLFSCEAAIGRNGITDSPAEGDGKTPAGTFPVLFCYGIDQPQTGIPFVQLTRDNVWVDDSDSEYYNCLTTKEKAGNASYEDTYSQFTRGYYSCNIFFANNGDGHTPGSATPGKGSVRVLEGYLKSLEPTSGDIKISSQNMTTLLGLLDERYDPVVIVSN